MADDFDINLMRALLAEAHFHNQMTVAREMFGKGYFALSETEVAIARQVALVNVGSIYNLLTAPFLQSLGQAQSQTPQPNMPVGFQAPPPAKAEET